MAREVELTFEVLESVEKSIGFISAIYREQWSQHKIYVRDLVEEIRRLKRENEALKHNLSGEGEGAKKEEAKLQGSTGIQRDQDG